MKLDKVEVLEVFIGEESQGLYTKQAYSELRLMMSTGDFHMHTTKKVLVEDFNDVNTMLDVIN